MLGAILGCRRRRAVGRVLGDARPARARVAAKAAAAPPVEGRPTSASWPAARSSPRRTSGWVRPAASSRSTRHDRAEQDKFNKDRQSFEQQVQQRFGKLEEQLRAQSAAPSAPAGEPAAAGVPAAERPAGRAWPRSCRPRRRRPARRQPGPSPGMPPGTPLTRARSGGCAPWCASRSAMPPRRARKRRLRRHRPRRERRRPRGASSPICR
ncbi:MAG: hypothetical protein MZW92_61030 [Comamonadaceae bacterium]|nr:hypothetical protein [Comamonadaceae bacterium]